MISVIIPVYNEEEGLPELYRRLTIVLEDLGESYEIIFVNDGSHDRSLEIIKELHAKDIRVKFIDLSRNFGHQIAITAGMDYVSGNAAIIMDADLQDPPEVLPQMVAKWREGYAVVYALRRKRKENLAKRACYFAFYRILRRLASIDIPPDAGVFCLMDQRVVRELRRMPEQNRFVRGLRSWVGFKQIGLEFERDIRFAGETKHSFSKLVKIALDGFISFSHLPLRAVSYLGFAIASISFFGAALTLFQRLFTDTTVCGYTIVLISVLFIGGIQLLSIGLIGEYIGRIYDEAKNRPLYIVQDSDGFEEADRSILDKKAEVLDKGGF